jgi:hypothetical protein
MAKIIYLDTYRKTKEESDKKDDVREEIWDIVTSRLLIEKLLERTKKE